MLIGICPNVSFVDSVGQSKRVPANTGLLGSGWTGSATVFSNCDLRTAKSERVVDGFING